MANVNRYAVLSTDNPDSDSDISVPSGRESAQVSGFQVSVGAQEYNGPHVHTLLCPCTIAARISIGARIAWIEQRARSKEEIYPVAGRYISRLVAISLPPCTVDAHRRINERNAWIERRKVKLGRYETRTIDIDLPTAQKNLSESTKWIVDVNIAPPAELHRLWMLVMQVEAGQISLQHVIDDLIRKGPHSMANVEDFTTPWTAQAMATADTTCHICYDTCGFGVDQETAVKTSCNHIFGNTCLQQWIEYQWIKKTCKSIAKCPMCRQPLFDKEHTLMKVARPLHQEVKRLRAWMARLGPVIDKFLMEQPKAWDEWYGPDMEKLQEEMAQWIQEASHVYHKLVQVAQN